MTQNPFIIELKSSKDSKCCLNYAIDDLENFLRHKSQQWEPFALRKVRIFIYFFMVGKTFDYRMLYARIHKDPHVTNQLITPISLKHNIL